MAWIILQFCVLIAWKINEITSQFHSIQKEGNETSVEKCLALAGVAQWIEHQLQI